MSNTTVAWQDTFSCMRHVPNNRLLRQEKPIKFRQATSLLVKEVIDNTLRQTMTHVHRARIVGYYAFG